MPYIGKSPSAGVRQRYQYTATAGQTTFSGADTASLTLNYTDNNFVDVFQNGVLLKGGGTDYTATSGTSVVLATGASVSDVIEIIVYDVFSVGNFYNRTDSDSRYVNVDGDTITGTLLIGTDTGDAFNSDSILRLGRSGDRAFLQFKTDADQVSGILFGDVDDDVECAIEYEPTNKALTLSTNNNTEAVRIDSSRNVLIGKTVTTLNTEGIRLEGSEGKIECTRDGNVVGTFNRTSSDGTILEFDKDGTVIGTLGSDGSDFVIDGGSNHTGLRFGTISVTPRDNGAQTDNSNDFGSSAARWDDIFATNGTINTSDQNEKQDIASATTKELNVAKKLSSLFKTFRWKDKVAEKGDKARTHTGIIAQEIQSAFSAEGLDASNYGLFISDTWWEKEIKVDAVEEDEEKGIEAKDAYTYMDIKEEKTDGYTEKTRLGVRYPELFSFIFSSIEARLTALESK